MESPLVKSAAAEPDARPRRRLPRAVLAGALLIAVFAAIALWVLRRPQREADLIERIKAAGGFVSHEPPASLQERISALRAGSEWDAGYTSVRLYASDITGAWLSDHDDLTTLAITDLKLAETSLTDADLARLIRAHPLQVVEFRQEEVGDLAINALAGCRRLFILELRDSPLTDGQFARLPIEQLEQLRIDGSLAPAGLQELQRAARLDAVTLDGRQLTDATAQILGRLPALRSLELIGETVTDDRLLHLQQLTALESMTLRSTATTHDGVEQLKSKLPNCEVRVR